MTENRRFFESVHLLRGASAFIVLIAHNFGWYSLPGIDPVLNIINDHCNLGQIGVTIFFVISGFVLPLSLVRSYALIDYHRFLAKRFIRVEPAYLVSILISVSILMLKTRMAPNATPFPFELQQFLAHLLYLIPFTDFDWFNEVYWTLAIEFQFYLLIALIFPIWKKGAIAGVVTGCLFSFLFLLGDSLPEVGLFVKAPLFAAGMLSLSAVQAARNRDRFAIFILAVLNVCGYSFVTGGYDTGLAAIAAVALIVYWDAPRLPLRYFGTISYSVYIVHYPIVFLTNQTARHFLGSDGHPLLYCVAFGNLFLVVIAAHLMYKFVEEPTQKLSKKIKYKADL